MRASPAQAVSPLLDPLDRVHRATDRVGVLIRPAPWPVPRCFRNLAVAPPPLPGIPSYTVSLPLAVPFLQSVSFPTSHFWGLVQRLFVQRIRCDTKVRIERGLIRNEERSSGESRVKIWSPLTHGSCYKDPSAFGLGSLENVSQELLRQLRRDQPPTCTTTCHRLDGTLMMTGD
jgi:hypothetical protein